MQIPTILRMAIGARTAALAASPKSPEPPRVSIPGTPIDPNQVMLAEAVEPVDAGGSLVGGLALPSPTMQMVPASPMEPLPPESPTAASKPSAEAARQASAWSSTFGMNLSWGRDWACDGRDWAHKILRVERKQQRARNQRFYDWLLWNMCFAHTLKWLVYLCDPAAVSSGQRAEKNRRVMQQHLTTVSSLFCLRNASCRMLDLGVAVRQWSPSKGDVCVGTT